MFVRPLLGVFLVEASTDQHKRVPIQQTLEGQFSAKYILLYF